MSKNLRQKGLTKVVKNCVKITPDFVSNGQKDVKRGIIVLNGDKMGSKVRWPMYTGFSWFEDRLFPGLARCVSERAERGAVDAGLGELRQSWRGAGRPAAVLEWRLLWAD
jgi:hypothetical protein